VKDPSHIIFFSLCVYVLLGRYLSRGGAWDDQRWCGDDDVNDAADPEKAACGAEED
jgi:hypothetical protein